MQPITWYWQRLRAMSPEEIWWRLGAGLQESVDRCALPLRHRPIPVAKIAEGNGASLRLRSNTLGARLPGDGESADGAFLIERWRTELTGRADQLLDNRLGLFDMEEVDFGSRINWNYEWAAKIDTPMAFAPQIDYRDYAVVGDAKVVWEPNRHQHLVVLARAYRVSQDRRYAEKVVEQIESWIRQCPYGRGMNWRSPLELAIRLINWVWALELIAPSEVVTAPHLGRVLPVAYRHLWDISRKYSRYSSANNHLVGEAAGVFIGSSYFKSLKNADAWNEQSREILLREIGKQTFGDGGHCELAMGYHLFVLEFFLLAGVVARNVGRDFPVEYWKRLEGMFEFLAAFAEGGEMLPMFGDSDDGYVLDLGGGRNRAGGLLAAGAAMFGRSDFKALSGEFSEPAYWLLGEAGYEAFTRLDNPAADSIRSRALPDSGFYLLQSGRPNGSARISVTFDCGDLGFGAIAAHGHADALSFTLRAFGMDVFVDPGTFDYFTHPQWRDYFRSTRAHNTLVIDDRDQSEMRGPFLWGRRAKARCLHWEPSTEGGTVTGEHDGYQRLSDPVTHRRTITLEARRSEVVVRDELTGADRHDAAMYLHLAEHCLIKEVGPNRYEIDCGRGTVLATVDPCLSVSLTKGSEEPILGWVSRGYHRKKAGTTIVGRCRWTGSLALETRITLEGSRS